MHFPNIIHSTLSGNVILCVSKGQMAFIQQLSKINELFIIKKDDRIVRTVKKTVQEYICNSRY